MYSNFIHSIFFFFNDTATTEIYTLSLHDALPISLLDEVLLRVALGPHDLDGPDAGPERRRGRVGLGHRSLLGVGDRKSTRLNSSHRTISYAVFCLKKKKTTRIMTRNQSARYNDHA